MPEVEELSFGKCRELLGGGVFGRVALCTDEGPMIVPVNYSLVSETILFRTGRESLLGRHAGTARMAFEVDHVQYAEQRGWSVVATGPSEVVVDPEELEHIERTWAPRPWASGDRPLYVRIAWEQLTGRRLGSGWTYAEELPVRRHL
jgi:uncharacterized protein